MLTPSSDDPRRAEELLRQQKRPEEFGESIPDALARRDQELKRGDKAQTSPARK